MDCFIALEMSLNRMTLFSSGRAMLNFDRAVSGAITSGITPKTIAAVAMSFGGDAQTLSSRRSDGIKAMLNGGVVTRLKIEVDAVGHQKPGGEE